MRVYKGRGETGRDGGQKQASGKYLIMSGKFTEVGSQVDSGTTM